uniref:SDR family oxidoreductase n=1 Tax=Thaumasiovibrio occultus TaxID=1891184 RepID=UPI000B35B5C2|nr:SDR family oxidoreductase [Thaumasiovibrio occultus]
METVLITGANRGIGLALTEVFLAQGKRVIATCRQPEAASALQALHSQGELTILPLEVTAAASISELATSLQGQAIDIVFNNAGVLGGEQQSVDEMDIADWANVLAINTIAPFQLSVALKPNLLLSKRPRLITISSSMGSLAGTSTNMYSYRSSKAAVNKVMQVLSNEWAADGIIVCPVHPGWVRTDMGGADADISVEESTSGLVALANNLTAAQSGRFWSYDGEELPW